MPRYTYECTEGHVYEKREGFEAPVEQPCQECEAEARRIPVAPAIVFKGTGFYKTDSRTGSHESGGKAEDGKGSDKAPEVKGKEPTASSPAKAAGKSEGKAGGKSGGVSGGKSKSTPKS